MAVPDPRRRALVVGVVVGVPASIVFLWLAVRGADADAVWDALAGANLGELALAVALMLLVYGVQAARWKLIAATPTVPFRRFTGMVVSGIAVNNVLPGRLGDLFRARWLAVAARMPSGRAFATVILDRSGDVVALTILLALSFWAASGSVWVRRIGGAALIGLLALAVLLVAARVYVRRRDRSRRAERRLIRRLARDVVEGLAEPLGARRIIGALALSIVAWVCWSLAAILVAGSVGIELGLVDAFFVTAVVNLGVALPSSPGFVGTYQWLAVASLGLLGVGREDALAFSILLQASWYVPTTLIGGAVLGVRGLRRAHDRRLLRDVA